MASTKSGQAMAWPNCLVLMPLLVWHWSHEFSSGGVCTCVASYNTASYMSLEDDHMQEVILL